MGSGGSGEVGGEEMVALGYAWGVSLALLAGTKKSLALAGGWGFHPLGWHGVG